MAKKNKTPKEPTIKTAPPNKKKRGIKKPTVNIGAPPLNEEDKPKAKPIALKKPRKAKQAKPEPQKKEAKPRETDLRKGAPTEAAAQPKPESEREQKPQKSVVVTFVCTGNTCRSAMAQYIFRNYLDRIKSGVEFEVGSAGLMADTGSDMSENAYAALKERGVYVAVHFAVLLTRSDVDRSDLVVCMSQSHKRAIGQDEKIKTLSEIDGGGDVPDPYGQPLSAYRETADRLFKACPKVYEAALKAAYPARI